MIQNILFDFDGVILDSMPIRDRGFLEIFKDFPKNQVDQLMDFHNKNGGISRYVKIRYFYNEVLGQPISDEKVNEYAARFSEIMTRELTNKAYLIADSVTFLEKNHKNYRMHIVSGSDQTELRFLCKELEVAPFFISIHGSPTPKPELVRLLLEEHGYNRDETILIGDTLNDYDAARANDIGFWGYNNLEIRPVVPNYIERFSDNVF